MPPLVLLAITFIAPQEVQQGQVIRLTATQAEPGLTASFAGKDFPIFPNNGRSLALIPVGVFQPPGAFPITVKSPNAAFFSKRPLTAKAAISPSRQFFATD